MLYYNMLSSTGVLTSADNFFLYPTSFQLDLYASTIDPCVSQYMGEGFEPQGYIPNNQNTRWPKCSIKMYLTKQRMCEDSLSYFHFKLAEVNFSKWCLL